MVNSDMLHQVRTVEDIRDKGTIVSASLESSDRWTLFPLQAGLGYTLTQNLFIGIRNCLVEGPADLIYWKYFSVELEKRGRTALNENIVIVPTGGLGKTATFVSLLYGNELEFAVVTDYEGKRDQQLDELIREKILNERQVHSYADFRPKSASNGLVASDVEDMISEKLYLKLFSEAYAAGLGGKKITAKDLPAGDRIVLRINQYLKDNGITLRPSGGFNHYLIASHLASHPLSEKELDEDTLARFEALFTAINKFLG
jgi:hypothetical protein